MLAALKDKLARRWLKIELEAYKDEMLRLRQLLGEARASLAIEANSLALLREKMGDYENAVLIAVDRLELIAEKETSGANGTVRSMTKIARAAIAAVKQEIRQ